MNILEGKIAPEVQIQDDQSEEVVFKTVSQEIWQRLERGMHNLMESITLADLKQRIREVQKEKSEGHMYYI